MSSLDSNQDWLDPELISWAVIPVAIAVIIVALRFYTRQYITKKIEIEDWFALAALLLSIGVSIGTGRQAYFALGKHLTTITPERLSDYFQAMWYSMLFYHLAFCLVKASILLLYIRVFKSYDTLRRAAWIVLAIVAVALCGILAVIMTACIPLHKQWDKAYEHVDGYCHPDGVWWAVTGFQAGSDTIIFLMPLPTIYRLRLPRRQKVGLVAVFAVGLFVCFISIMRIGWIYKSSDADFTYTGTSVAEWSCVELNAAIVCASLMSLKPLYHKLHPHRARLVLGDKVSGTYEPPPTVGAARVRPMLQIHDSALFNSGNRISRPESTHNSPDAHTDDNDSLRIHGFVRDSPRSPTFRIMSPTLPAKPFFIESSREKSVESIPATQLGSPLSVRVW